MIFFRQVTSTKLSSPGGLVADDDEGLVFRGQQVIFDGITNWFTRTIVHSLFQYSKNFMLERRGTASSNQLILLMRYRRDWTAIGLNGHLFVNPFSDGIPYRLG
jgi:hypothetical protein